jgi:DNA-binding GntR family transcriptional regulator
VSSVGERTREVYEQLRAEIAQGVLRPNERLVEVDLAERLSVSRTPIRESIQRLAADGLVVNRRRAWFVREHTPDEIRSFYEVREALEGFAAGLAAARASADERREIVALSRADLRDDVHHERFVIINSRFHSAVAAAAQNPALTRLLAANRDFYFNRRISVAYGDADVQQAVDEHAALADAVARGDSAEAEAITRRHISRSLEFALRKLA